MMREPKTHAGKDERAILPFVDAMEVEEHSVICDLLMMHEADLAVQEGGPLYLVPAEGADRVVEFVEILESRSKRRATDGFKNLWPGIRSNLLDCLVDVRGRKARKGEVPSKDDFIPVITQVVRQLVGSRDEEQMMSLLLLNHKLVGDFVASGLAKLLHTRRQSQMGGHFGDAVRYERLIAGLVEHNLAQERLRIVFHAPGYGCEVTILSSAARGPNRAGGSARISAVEIASDVARLKSGQERALPIFISAFLNRDRIEGRFAFPCARMAGRDGPELDVIVPALGLGVEVKVHQSPATANPSKLSAYAGKLGKQVGEYKKAGADQFAYVTNLEQDAARRVLDMAMGKPPIYAQGHVEVIGGMERLADWLRKIQGELEKLEMDGLDKAARARADKKDETTRGSRRAAKGRQRGRTKRTSPAKRHKGT